METPVPVWTTRVIPKVLPFFGDLVANLERASLIRLERTLGVGCDADRRENKPSRNSVLRLNDVTLSGIRGVAFNVCIPVVLTSLLLQIQQHRLVLVTDAALLCEDSSNGKERSHGGGQWPRKEQKESDQNWTHDFSDLHICVMRCVATQGRCSV